MGLGGGHLGETKSGCSERPQSCPNFLQPRAAAGTRLRLPAPEAFAILPIVSTRYLTPVCLAVCSITADHGKARRDLAGNGSHPSTGRSVLGAPVFQKGREHEPAATLSMEHVHPECFLLQQLQPNSD